MVQLLLPKMLKGVGSKSLTCEKSVSSNITSRFSPLSCARRF